MDCVGRLDSSQYLQWQCEQCTLLNSPLRNFCEACGYLKGDDHSDIGNNTERVIVFLG